MLDFEQFKILHSEIIMFYQVVENDLKLIYAYMKEGEVDDNYKEVETKTLGKMIAILKDLDNKDGDPDISNNDYNFLKQLSQNRNHWAHEVFINFVYIEDFIRSSEYEKECRRLQKDHDRLSIVHKNVERVRIKLCGEIYRR